MTVGSESAVAAVADAPDEPAQPLLVAKNVSAGYGGVPIIRALNLEVRPGEVVALVGANGAGKTTTLLSLTGVLRPLAGSVTWLGRTKHVPLHQRARAGLGFVPESRTIIPSLSTLDNLRLGRAPVEEALELLPELKPLLKRKAGLLSGGEQQILILARVLAAKPKLLLADELSLGLAPLIVGRLLQSVREVADAGIGVLIVEQQVQNVLSIADRVYVLRRGEVVLEGAAADLKSRLGEIEATYFSSTSTS
jgi:branched-chain amino acid transport system ATP-binding protein